MLSFHDGTTPTHENRFEKKIHTHCSTITYIVIYKYHMFFSSSGKGSCKIVIQCVQDGLVVWNLAEKRGGIAKNTKIY